MGKTNESALKIMIDPEMKGLKGLKSGMVKAVAESTTVFSKKTATAFANNVKQSMRDLEAGVTKIKELEARLNKKGLIESEKKRVQEQIKDARARNGMIEQELRTRLKGQNKELKVRQEAFEKMAKSQASIKGIGEMGKKIGDEIKGAFDDIFKSKDLGKMIEGSLGRVGKGVTAAGGGLMKMGGGLGAFGEILSKLGPAISALSAIATGFVSVFKIFMDADAHMKELNKTMLEGGTVANDLVGKYGMIGPSLNQVTRHFAAATRLSWELGTTAKENIQILSAYGGANVSLQKLSGGLKDAALNMANLEKATIGAVAYARLFGTSYTEMATNFGDYMTRLGLTLQGVEERFSAIAVAARDSGFSTKRFMGTLLQATSGMSMYNVRIEETAGLLVDLGKILGEKMGGEFLQNLTQGMRGESTQDLTKRVLTTGVGLTKRIEQGAAVQNAADFKKKALDTDANPMIARTLRDAGIDLSKTPAEIAKAIGTLPEETADALTTALKGYDPAMGGAFSGVRRAGLSYQGGGEQGMGGAVAAARAMGPAATLLMNLSKMVGVTGKRLDQVSELDIVGQMAAEHISGKQGEEMMQYRAVGKEFDQRAKKLAELASGAGTDEGMAKIDAFNETLGRSWNTYVDKATGEWFKSTKGPNAEAQDRVVIADKSMEGLVLASGDELTQMNKTNVDENLDVASEVAENTRSIQDILENGVAAVLSTINETLSKIFGWITGETEAKEEILKVIDEMGAEVDANAKALSGSRAALFGMQDKYRGTKDPVERAALKTEMTTQKAKIKEQEETLRVSQKALKGATRLRTRADLGQGIGVDIKTAHKKTVERLKQGGLSQVRGEDIEKGLEEDAAARVQLEVGASAEVQKKASELAAAKNKERGFTDQPEIKETYLKQLLAQEAATKSGKGQAAVPGLKGLIPDQPAISNADADRMKKDAEEARKTGKKNVKADLDKQTKVGKDLQANADANAELVSKTMRDLSEDAQAGALAGILEKAGMGGEGEDLMAVARAMMSGQAVNMPQSVKGNLAKENLYSVGKAHDALLLSGPMVGKPTTPEMRDRYNQRTGAAETSSPPVSTKGPLASSSRGSVNVFHLYGEGPGVLNTITKAQAAGMIG